MKRKGELTMSNVHHWWPVGLQKYWSDEQGDVWSIAPDGSIDHKRWKRRKIGKKIAGHRYLRGSAWETNFEDAFSADNELPKVVNTLLELQPHTSPIARGQERSLKALCTFHDLAESTQRSLLLALLSLLIRSPAKRYRYESFPKIGGLPPNERIGKVNMDMVFRRAKPLCEAGNLSNQYFVLIYSQQGRFIFGDGMFDCLTDNVATGMIHGRALVPLTPTLCVYVCTPNPMITSPNCASLIAPQWVEEAVNEIVQVHSERQLFYKGESPTLLDVYRRAEYLEYDGCNVELIDRLDNIAAMGGANPFNKDKICPAARARMAQTTRKKQ